MLDVFNDMKFLEEITATAGQLIKDLEQHIDYVSFEHNWDKNDDEGIDAAKMLEVLKNLDPGAGCDW